MWRKHNASVPAHDEIIDEVQADLRTSWSRASATEGRARRAVCSTESCWSSTASPPPRSCTDVFEADRPRDGRAVGPCPTISFLAMPHPIANLTEAELGPAGPRDGAEDREAPADGPGVAAASAPGCAPVATGGGRRRSAHVTVHAALVVSPRHLPTVWAVVRRAGGSRARERSTRPTVTSSISTGWHGRPGPRLLLIVHGLEGGLASHYVGGLLRLAAAPRLARRRAELPLVQRRAEPARHASITRGTPGDLDARDPDACPTRSPRCGWASVGVSDRRQRAR